MSRTPRDLAWILLRCAAMKSPQPDPRPARLGLRLLACLLVCGLGACGFDLSDDVDLSLDFSPLIGPSSSLHSPYVKGARFGVFLHDTSSQDRIQPDWRIESSQPSVLEISEVKIGEYDQDGKRRRYLQGKAWARDEGRAEIVVRDAGGEIFRTSVEVLRPDRIDLLAHGPLLIGRPEAEAVAMDIQLLAGGTGTFLARYSRDGRALSGNGALSVQASGDVAAEVRRTFLFEDRDWVQLTMGRKGLGQVELQAAGEAIARVIITGVDESAIEGVALRDSERLRSGEARDGDWLVVLAEAADRQARQIYGVEYKWSFGGAQQQGLGDLFRYEYKSGMRRLLSAAHEGKTAALMIEAKGGFVDSTNHLGCAAAPGRAGAPAPHLLCAALLPLLLLGSRRRRLAPSR